MPDLLQRYLRLPLPLTRAGAVRDASVLSLPHRTLFASASLPEAAWSGLLLRAGCWEESHQVSQDLSTAEGSYWHGIAHRMEPDSFNAGYWLRRVGQHSIYPELQAAAEGIINDAKLPWRLRASWDASLLVDWCEEARLHPGSAQEAAALRMHDAEWKLLFDYCLSDKKS